MRYTSLFELTTPTNTFLSLSTSKWRRGSWISLPFRINTMFSLNMSHKLCSSGLFLYIKYSFIKWKNKIRKIQPLQFFLIFVEMVLQQLDKNGEYNQLFSRIS